MPEPAEAPNAETPVILWNPTAVISRNPRAVQFPALFQRAKLYVHIAQWTSSVLILLFSAQADLLLARWLTLVYVSTQSTIHRLTITFLERQLPG